MTRLGESGRWIAVVVAAAGAGCGTSTAGRETPPDRALFRLAAAGESPIVAADVVIDDPTGPLVPAYTASLRILRGDGTAITAPHITTYAGQRAMIQMLQQTSFVQDFDVERKGDSWLADPIIGMLHSGLFVEVTILDVEGRPGEAALAFSMRTADVRRPIAARTVGPLAPGFTQPVTIQMPRVESAEVLGARRVTLGVEFEIARLPDPSGAGENVVRATVVRGMVPKPADAAFLSAPEEEINEELNSGPAAVRDDEAADRVLHAKLQTLGAAAAKGAESAALRVTAIRMPAAAFGDPDARGVERLATLAVDSVIVPGATLSDRLGESYLADWDVDTSGDGACDPIVKSHDSGLTVTVADGGALNVAWRTTPRFEQFSWAPFDRSATGTVTNAPPPSAQARAFRLTIDRPTSTASERRIPLTRGRSVHPVFRLPDGGTAAVVVEYDPAR